MSSNGDDELERRLRDVLSSRGLGVPVSPDAINRIHAGARRRQQRRSAASALSAVAIIAIAAVGIGLHSNNHGPTTTAGGHTPSPLPAPVSASSAVSVSATALSSQASTPSSVASGGVVEPSGSGIASTPPPTTFFTPVSVSAIGVNDFWVLGYTQSGTSASTTVMQTTDAGKTFNTDASPKAIIASLARGPAGNATVSDIRFGDTKNGWAYGAGLFETADGGSSWSNVTSVPGAVVDLAAASGNVWAIAASGTSTMSYALYHATYGTSGTSAWTQVNLGVLPVGSQPSVVVIKKVAYVLVPRTTASSLTYVIANGGATHTTLPGPCGLQQDGTLSVAGDGSVWAVCNFGHSTADFVATSLANKWQQVSYEPLTFSLGGVDAKHAVLSHAPSGFALVSNDGSSTPLTLPNTQITSASFIGFTTTTVGFMIADGQPYASQLLRTTDGGQTWTAVTF